MRFTTLGKTMSFSVKLDPKCIVKQGYLVKSPPLDQNTFIRRRWHLRWFVLYDNGAGDVILYYFDSEQSVKQGRRPKGKISLVGAEVYKQRGRLHGYSYTINVQTMDRLYHLCSTHESVHDSWLDKIRDHYIPTEIHRASISQQQAPRCDPRPSLTGEERITLNRTSSNVSNRSVKSNSDDEVDYRDSEMNTFETLPSNKHTSLPRDLKRINEKPCPKPPNVPPILREFTAVDEVDDRGYITMVADTSKQTKPLNVDSEDEGIGRSGSDLSNRSASTTSSLTNPSSSSTFLPSFTTLRTTALRNSMDQLLLDGYVGPKLTNSRETTKQVSRARSLENLLSPSPPPRSSSAETERPVSDNVDTRSTKDEVEFGDF